jgi:hypothetical protein
LPAGKNGAKIYMKGDYEEFYALRQRKNKANSKPISNVGLDVAWIPAFAGMTKMESLLDGKF